MSDQQHDIEKYLKGELTHAERHALEKKALSDPFLAEALEGAEQIGGDAFSHDVAQLNKKIQRQKIPSAWVWPMRIAAGLVLLLVSSYIVWLAVDSQVENRQVALQKEEPLQTTATDSVHEEQDLSEQPTAGPADPDKIVRRSPNRESKPTQPVTGKSQYVPEAQAGTRTTDIAKTEDVAILKESKESKVTEEVTPIKPVEREADVVAKTEEVQRAKKLSLDTRSMRKEDAPSASSGYASIQRIIHGKVTSTEDGKGLPGVNVIIKGTTTGTTTDADGNYQITVPQENPTLLFSFIGLQSTEVQAGGKNQLDVNLGLDATQLSEVVVTGYGVERSNGESIPTVDLTHPTNGYRAFKQYLLQNLRYPEEAQNRKSEGRVTVEFTIETNGALTNFIIVRSIGYGCDEELIRLIQQGPAWIPTKKDGVPLQDKAKVRLKFELPH